MRFRQLLPEPATVDVAELLGALDFGAMAPDDRPYTIVNFIASADGRATLQGRSGGLGDDGDKAMFHGLREQVDGVLAGTRTLAIERYGRLLGKQERRERRRARGRDPEPLACVISRSGNVPSDIPLFAEPEARIVVFVPEDVDTSACQADVTVVRLDPGQLTLTTALRQLRADFGVCSLLCEGGPTMFGSLLHEQLVDELFLTIAPKLAGGGRGPTTSSGPELAEPASLSVRWLLEREQALYIRYAIAS